MKNILVVGAKKGANIPKNANITYFVNGAASISKSFDKKIEKIAFLGNRNILEEKELTKLNKKVILSGDIKEFISINFINKSIKNEITKHIKSFKLTEISRFEKKKLERKILYRNLPLFLIASETLLSTKEKIKFILYFIKRKEYKVSTGVFCVLYLIDTFGEQYFKSNNLIISGIGLDTNKYFHTSFDDKSKKKGHYINDIIALRILKRKYPNLNILTTEHELHQKFDFQHFQKKHVE